MQVEQILRTECSRDLASSWRMSSRSPQPISAGPGEDRQAVDHMHPPNPFQHTRSGNKGVELKFPTIATSYSWMFRPNGVHFSATESNRRQNRQLISAD